jgi:GTPase SAR1 family protein
MIQKTPPNPIDITNNAKYCNIIKMITTNRTEPSQAEYKIILIGDPSVGKTCYISKYTNRSSTLSGSTIGVEYASKVIDLPNQSTCKVTLWDTSGS